VAALKDRLWLMVRDRRFHRWALVAAALGCGVVLGLWKSGLEMTDVMGWLKLGKDFLVEHPGWLFVALVILNGLPFPASVLFVMAGVVWGERPMVACGYGLTALVLNQAWTYALAAGPAHTLVGRVLSRCGWKIPVLKTENVTDTLLVMRLVPGIPLFVQNYVLGLLRVPYGRYAWMSLVCSGPPVIGFILAGAGIAGGEWKIALLGIAVLALALVAVRVFLRKKKLREEVPSER
jgi:uncharacterized membrane protein YdjX (TVP38/TMEM64 family)